MGRGVPGKRCADPCVPAVCKPVFLTPRRTAGVNGRWTANTTWQNEIFGAMVTVTNINTATATADVTIGPSCWDCPAPPTCTASTDCTGVLTISCNGVDVGVEFNGNCHLASGEPTPCVAGFTGASTVSAGGNVFWIGSTTSPNTAQACTVNAFGETCIPVTTPVPPACPISSAPPQLCSAGQRWCTRYNPARCVPMQECLVTQPKVPATQPP